MTASRLLIRTPTDSPVKLSAITLAVGQVFPRRLYELTGLAVNLQDRQDLAVNAQPVGMEQTLAYARLRRRVMCEIYGPSAGLDIVVESGAISYVDIAVALLYVDGQEYAGISDGVAFPPGTFEEAMARGFKTTTVGQIIHERDQAIPANDW